MNYSELLQLAKGWGNFISNRVNIWRLPYIVIRYVLNEYKLPKLLERWFPKDIGLLMDLVSYLIVDEECK